MCRALDCFAEQVWPSITWGSKWWMNTMGLGSVMKSFGVLPAKGMIWQDHVVFPVLVEIILR